MRCPFFCGETTKLANGDARFWRTQGQSRQFACVCPWETNIYRLNSPKISRAAKRGCFKPGGVSRSGFFCPFLSFLGLSRFFWDFPDLLGDGPGIFLICPFPLSRPSKSTYEEQSRKGPRHNLDLSRKKWETPGFGNTPV